MTANDNHAYLNRLYDLALKISFDKAFKISIIEQIMSHQKTSQNKHK